jgi:hypothetical protein
VDQPQVSYITKYLFLVAFLIGSTREQAAG